MKKPTLKENIHALAAEAEQRLKDEGLVYTTEVRSGSDTVTLTVDSGAESGPRTWIRLEKAKRRLYRLDPSPEDAQITLYALFTTTIYRKDRRGKYAWKTVMRRVLDSKAKALERQAKEQAREQRIKDTKEAMFRELGVSANFPYGELYVKRLPEAPFYEIHTRNPVVLEIAQAMILAAFKAAEELGLAKKVLEVPKVWLDLLALKKYPPGTPTRKSPEISRSDAWQPEPVRGDTRFLRRECFDGGLFVLGLHSYVGVDNVKPYWMSVEIFKREEDEVLFRGTARVQEDGTVLIEPDFPREDLYPYIPEIKFV